MEVKLQVRPEIKLPKNLDKAEDLKAEDLTSFDLHPFWLIKRQEKSDVPNADIIMQSHTIVAACDFKQLNDKGAEMDPWMQTITVHIPFIVNTKALNVNDEIILAWEQEKRTRRFQSLELA